MSGGGVHAPRAPRGGIRLAALIGFSCAMGWLEGVVVVYIRAVLGVPPGVPLPPGAEVLSRFLAHPWLLPTEQGRELATLVMLAGVAWLAGHSARARWGAFLVAFGVWDIVYYVALRALIGWPTSFSAMDVLFLIPPGPWWSQPVWVPVLIASAMVGIGLRLFTSAELAASSANPR